LERNPLPRIVKRAPKSDYLVLFPLWLMVFSASSQVIIISPILPRIGEALMVPDEHLGWLITAYATFLSVFALIIGPISDRVGRRRVLLIGSASMTFALMLHGLADSFSSLLVVRSVAGAAGGMLSGGAVSYVGDYFPYERRGWANGWVMSGIAVGQIIGIPIGTLVADSMGFRAAFMLFAVTMGFATLLIALFVPQPDVERSTGRLTVVGSLRAYWQLLRRPVIVAATIVYFLMFFSLGLYVIYLPTWIERALSVQGTAIASLFLVGGIANVISGPVAGRISDTIGRKPVIVASCVGLAIVMIATTHLIHSMGMAYIVFALAMAMVAMRVSPLQSLMTELVTADRRGALMCLAVALGQFGIGIGGAAAGPAYTHFGYASTTYAGAVAIALMAFMVQRFLPEPSAHYRPVARRVDGQSGSEETASARAS
jgi:predicted MFS family arabinose efflux permease